MRLGLLLSGLLLLAGAAHADALEAKADVFAHPLTPTQMSSLLGPSARPLAASPGLRGRFEQRKYLPDLPKPLLSIGEFLFARDTGVWWHTRTPFDSVFILTRDGARSRDEGGAETKVSAADQPGVAVAARIFFALFALDFEALSKDFDTYGVATGSGKTAGWQVGLRPKLAAMAAVFRESVIEGRQRADRIELRDAHGDRTEILLPEVTILSDGLTAADRQRFE